MRIEPRRGAFVVGVTEADIGDLCAFRLLVEQRAVRLAAERADAAGVAALREALGRMEEAVDGGRPALMVAPDVQFHRQIVAMSGSRHLQVAWERVSPTIATILGINDTSHSNLPQAIAGHRRLLATIASHDPDEAEASMGRHLANSEETIRAAMRSARAGAIGDAAG